MNASFWNGRKVLVTGHTGFKGSWLSLWLQKLGADVVGYALPPHTKPSLFEMAAVADGMTHIEADVRDLDRVKAVLAQHRPEIVIHMAAQALVRTAYADPVQTYTTNVIGTMNVLEAARTAAGLRVALMITSDKCYENQEWIWGYRENDRMGGRDPYSSSKGCAELVIGAYRHSFFGVDEHARHGVAVASARAGNVIGGGDWALDRLVPDILTAIMEGRAVQIRRPQATRPWQFVLEPLSGYLTLAEKAWERGPEFAQSWNFGPNVEEVRPVSWIVEFLTNYWGDGARWDLDSAEHPHEDHFLKLDTSKAKSLLGWSPRLTLATALEWVVEWYRAFQDEQDMRAFVHDQISRYERLGETE